jgi:SnoaL-like domain
MSTHARLLFAIAVIAVAPARLVAQDVGERVAAARARLEALDARVTRIEDINAIENLQRAYGYYVDKMLWDHVVDLFADDGTLELGMSGVYVGKESIRRYLLSLSEGRQGPLEGVLYDHMQLQPIITVAADGRTAQGRWRAWLLTGVSGSGSGGSWGEGPYENTYVKEDGIWKIRSLHWFGNFLVPYEAGWLNADPEQLRAFTASDVPPDRPPTVEYEPFPGTFIPPFHYRNPGRGDTAGGVR